MEAEKNVSRGIGMKYITGTMDFKIEEPTVVTIGKFDGRHRGHQKLIERMKEIREETGYKLAVFTFSIAPAALLGEEKAFVITTNEERMRNLRDTGVDYLVECPFTKEVAHMAPEEFVKEILVEKMGARAVVVGTDCGFGYKRSGNARLLGSLSETLGYSLSVIEKEKDEDRDISSTYVREEIRMGAMEKAWELLGEPYSIGGLVVHGNHIGSSRLGFPTANLLPPAEKQLPPFGVYVSRVYLDGKYYGGITNIGKKPTVEGENPIGAETFIYDFHGDIYGKEIRVELLHFERPERKFAGLEELKRQIERDKEYGLRYLAEHSEIEIG